MILLFWVAEADVAPVVISRLTWYPSLLALDTRYVADAVHVLAVCVGLAFIPLSGLASEGRAPAGARSQRLVVWTGTQANGANVQQVVLLVPSGTPVVDSDLAGDVTIAADSRASWVIGNISPGKSRWIGVPDGTSNNLRMFGPDGRLYYTQVSGMGSPARPAGRKCWAARKGQVVIPFFTSPRPAAQCCGSATSGTRITRWRSP